MKFLLVVFLLLSAVQLFADKWAYFYPEAVTTYSCKVSPVIMMNGRDANESHPAYTAEASAERSSNLGRWSMTIAVEPETPKGRRAALKACAGWMDEAEKRVNAAAPIRVNQHKEKK